MTLPIQSCNELRLLRNDHFQWITAAAASSCMQWITATAAPSCGQKKHTRWRSTSMLRSDDVQWITAACNELQLLLRHRAVRRNTHAGHDIPCYQLHRCCAIVRSDKTHTLAKYVYASKRSRALNYRCMQWITAAAAPSCGQKKHTRWPRHTLLPTT